MAYDIKIDLIPGLPKTAYRNGVGAWEGVCLHETACLNDSDESETAYFKENWKIRSAFVHAFCDHDSITQNADWAYKSWGCGNGNPRFINLELCNTQDAAKFLEGYKRWTWLAASKLFERKLGVVDGVTLVSHDWVSKNIGGTNHSDPISYLNSHGKTWANVVADVKAQYDAMANPPKPAAVPAPSTSGATKLDVGVANTIINTYLTPDWLDANAKAQAESDPVKKAAILKQRDYYHWLADCLRSASGQSNQ